jgi:hypothetical protein
LPVALDAAALAPLHYAEASEAAHGTAHDRTRANERARGEKSSDGQMHSDAQCGAKPNIQASARLRDGVDSVSPANEREE